MTPRSDPADASSAKPDRSGPPSTAPDFAGREAPDPTGNALPAGSCGMMIPMVGLGGSAGSVQALQAFFRALPPRTGMTFVVILHLSPDFDSTLADILGRSASIPVKQAADGEKVAVDHVYVIPPGKFLLTADGHLRLSPLEPERGRRVAVDLFFRSLADTHGPHSAAVVLSGADGDGAIGIKRIKERGGLTIAQDPDEAQYPGMPSAAVSTGMVDWILQAGEIPGRLMEYYHHGSGLNLSAGEDPSPAGPEDGEKEKEEEESGLREILLFLRTKTGRDFSCYKRGTVARRISRRLQVNGIGNPGGYLTFLRMHPGETGALIQDLLISVTNFFRDRDAFQALEERLPRLFEGRSHNDAIRLWVPACATGEEAYSLAMLMVEQAGAMDPPPAIQVFASDLDENAIRTARAGLYPAAVTADVSEERLRRFFIREPRGWRVRREIREMVLFAHHDLLRDAPFSRMDLVSCRNLLIYLKPEAQERVLRTFDFSLREGGLLFLGTPESVDGNHGAFGTLDKKHRLFVHRGRCRGVLPPGQDFTAFNSSLPEPAGPVFYCRQAPRAAERPAPSRRPSGEGASPADLHFSLMEQAGLPSIIVNAAYDIIHLSGGAGRFLEHGAGEPTASLFRLAHPMLRLELRAALLQAVERETGISVAGLAVETAGEKLSVDIRISPGREQLSGYWLIIFEARPPSPDSPPRPHEADPASLPVVAHLEREVDRLRTSLRDTMEQYEAGNEEMKASNEELQAMNEELRSATDELEASREELQSINEELSTVNQEMKSKMDELAHANSDLNNLMAATAIATVFLDKSLNITFYTPPAVALFNLIPGDIGRPLNNLKHQLEYPRLSADAAGVLSRLSPLEREVRTTQNQWFLARVLPYRTTEDFIAGVVLTFVDITARRRAEAALEESRRHLGLLLENARDYAIFTTGLDRLVTSWNSGAERLLGFSESGIMGKTADIIFIPEDRAAGVPEQEQHKAVTEGRASDERWHVRKNGSRFWASGSMMAMRDAAGNAVGLVKIFRDHTEARNTREALLRSREELLDALRETDQARRAAERATAAKDDFLAALSHELRTPLNPALLTVAALGRPMPPFRRPRGRSWRECAAISSWRPG